MYLYIKREKERELTLYTKNNNNNNKKIIKKLQK